MIAVAMRKAGITSSAEDDPRFFPIVENKTTQNAMSASMTPSGNSITAHARTPRGRAGRGGVSDVGGFAVTGTGMATTTLSSFAPTSFMASEISAPASVDIEAVCGLSSGGEDTAGVGASNVTLQV